MSEQKDGKETPYERILRETGVRAVPSVMGLPLTEGQADVLIDIVNESLRAPEFYFRFSHELTFSDRDFDGTPDERKRQIRQYLVEERGCNPDEVQQYLNYLYRH